MGNSTMDKNIISDFDFCFCPLTNLLGVPFSCLGGEKGIDTRV